MGAWRTLREFCSYVAEALLLGVPSALKLGAALAGVGVIGVVTWVASHSPWLVVTVVLLFVLVALSVGGFKHSQEAASEIETLKAEAAPIENLPAALDSLLRECYEFLVDCSRPLDEQYPGSQFPLLPPEEQVERLIDLDARGRRLLLAARPSLLHPFADAANAAMRREREAVSELDEDASDAEKLRHFVETSHGRLRIRAIGLAAGLAAARERLGHK